MCEFGERFLASGTLLNPFFNYVGLVELLASRLEGLVAFVEMIETLLRFLRELSGHFLPTREAHGILKNTLGGTKDLSNGVGIRNFQELAITS